MSDKPKLEMVQIPVFRVHYQEFERYVEKVFGYEYDYMQASRSPVKSGVDYKISGKFTTVAWDRRAEQLRKGRRERDPELILNVLAADGFIPAGFYTISTHPMPSPTNIYAVLLKRTGNPESPECSGFRAKHRGNQSVLEKLAQIDAAFRGTDAETVRPQPAN